VSSEIFYASFFDSVWFLLR